MRIHFLFVLQWLVPQLGGMSPDAMRQLIGAARWQSLPRIRRYGGWCLAASLWMPVVIMGALCMALDVMARPSGTALAAVLMAPCTLLSPLLMSVGYGLILRPAIRDLLTRGQWPPQ